MQRLEVLNGWVLLDVRAMGSDARLLAHGVDAQVVRNAADELARLEARWSRFRPHSDVTRMNAAAGRYPVVVSAETIALLERARRLWHATGGRFDPTILTALNRNGYDESYELVRARRSCVVSAPHGQQPLTLMLDRPTTSAPPAPAPGCDGIQIDLASRTVSLPEAVAIDLGGIGKGYAADMISEMLLAHGATTACVSMGGDIRCRGVGPHSGLWHIDVEDPFDSARTLFTARLRDSAIVTSTTLMRRWFHDGRTRHHLIDPASGEPSDNGVAAAIVADAEAWRAEGLAKAAIIAGIDGGLALLDRAGVAGYVVDVFGRAHPTSRAIDEVPI